MTNLAVTAGVDCVECADKVVAELGSVAEWKERFEAKRTWLPTFELKDVTEKPVVNVVTTRIGYRQATRTAVYVDLVCEIGVLEKPNPEQPNAIEVAGDKHAGLIEEIAEYFLDPAHREWREEHQVLNVISVEVPTLILRDHIEELQQLTSVVRLQLQLTR